MRALNYNPRLTLELARRGIFRDAPFRLLDVGARGGAHPIWDSFGADLEVVGFDPDAQSTSGHENARHRYIAAFIGARRERRRFYHGDDPAHGSLSPDEGYYRRTVLGSEMRAADVWREVQTVSLDECVSENALGTFDFLKIDTDGADFEVLQGASETLRTVLGVQVEVLFRRGKNAYGTYADIDALLQDAGFAPSDLELYRYARAALPQPALYDYRDADGSPAVGPTPVGEIAFGDALYTRDLIRDGLLDDPLRVLKLACVYELHRLADCAAELLLAAQDTLRAVVEPRPLLDLLTPLVEGAYPTYDEYLAYASRAFHANHDRVVGPNLDQLEALWHARERPEAEPKRRWFRR